MGIGCGQIGKPALRGVVGICSLRLLLFFFKFLLSAPFQYESYLVNRSDEISSLIFMAESQWNEECAALDMEDPASLPKVRWSIVLDEQYWYVYD